MTLSPAANRAVTRRVNIKNRNRSRIVSQIIERYLGIMRAHHLELSADELEHLGRLTEGWTLDFSTASALEGMVKVADVPEDLDVRKGSLLARLQAAGIAGAISAIEQLEGGR
jgi:hypothetical protein